MNSFQSKVISSVIGSIGRWAIAVACAATVYQSGSAATVVETVSLVAKNPTYAKVAPEARSFTVADAARLRLSVNDVRFPNALLWADVVVTRGSETVARLSQFGATDFDAAPGTYFVHTLGGGPSAGTVAVEVAKAIGGPSLLIYEAGVVANPVTGAAGRTTQALKVQLPTAGTYQLALTDRLFPVALSSFDAMLLNSQSTPVARICQPPIAGVCSMTSVSFNAPSGSYDLMFTAAAAAPLQAGLISIKIDGASNALSKTLPVGVLESHAYVELPSAGQYSLTLKDLVFPAALAESRALLAQGADVLANLNSASTQTFSAQAGEAVLFTLGKPADASGVGSLGVQIPYGTQTVFSDAKAIVSGLNGSNGARAYAFVGTLPSAGQYRFRARDFGFPTTIPSLQFLVTQDGSPLGGFTSEGALTTQAHAGSFLVIAVANVLSSTATGLFGLTVDAVSDGSVVLEKTQGVGDLFDTRSLALDRDGRFDVTLRDLAFPLPFEDLALIVTKGDAMVGQIFGGGTFSFPATKGTYSLNFVARNQSAANYGLYGVTVADAPPAPSVTFTAASLSVSPQGTTTVSWSSTGATGCTASGGWSGTKPTSGSAVSVGPFAIDTTLSLTCTGAGGSKSADLKISVVTSNASTSGGGAFDAAWLIALAVLAAATRRRYRRHA